MKTIIIEKGIYFFVVLVFFGILMVGCQEEKSLQEQQKECVKEGGIFKIEKSLNFRTGAHEPKGVCQKK